MKTSNVSRDHPRAIVDGWVDPVALPPGDGGQGVGGGPTQTQNAAGVDLLTGATVVLANDGTLVVTTTAGDTRPVGVALDDIAWGSFGPVAWQGPVPRINLDSAGTAGDYVETSTTAGEGTDVGATPTAASFGYLTGSGTSPSAFLTGGGSSGVGLHASSHENGGADEINATGLTGAGEFTETSTVHRTAGDVTTSSTTFVDVTGMTVTITTAAVRCLVIFTATMFNDTAAANTAVDLAIDGTRVGGTYGLVHNYDNTAAFNANASFSYLTNVLTAGSHTLKIQFRVDNGASTGKIYASATDPARLSVLETSQTT